VIRVAFHVLALTSLILFIATVSMWVRGYFVEDSFGRVGTNYPTHARFWSIYAGRAGFGIHRMDVFSPNAPYTDVPAEYRWQWTSRPSTVTLYYGLPLLNSGVSRVHRNSVGDADDVLDTKSMACGTWLPTLIFFPLPAIWFWQLYRRQKRPTPGHCPTCGYDLRASPDRCPECGTETAATPITIK
jgi:hypothetical protein